jgi:hypothetical protein
MKVLISDEGIALTPTMIILMLSLGDCVIVKNYIESFD